MPCSPKVMANSTEKSSGTFKYILGFIYYSKGCFSMSLGG